MFVSNVLYTLSKSIYNGFIKLLPYNDSPCRWLEMLGSDKGLSLYYTSHVQPFPKQALTFTCVLYKSFENTVGKGKNAPNEQFLLFTQCVLPIWRTFFHFHHV